MHMGSGERIETSGRLLAMGLMLSAIGAWAAALNGEQVLAQNYKRPPTP